jgi:geranylgeranyl diphosphate synthase type II
MTEAELKGWRDESVRRLNLGLGEIFAGLKAGAPEAVVNLVSAMNYTIESGGKRLRALLTLAAAEAAGGEEGLAMPGALAIEMVHAYSLVHDDLPALDDDDLRRGRPTCHLVYGESAAILAGDALQSLAFQTLTEAAASSETSPDRTSRLLKAALILARAIGPLGMVGGQAMDLAFEGLSPDLSQVKTMEEKKTGWLIGACLAIGATLGGAGASAADSLRKAGRLAGLAFQITDDILNINGDPDRMGKNVGTDARKAKASITAALSQSEADGLARRLIGQSLDMLQSFRSKKLEWLLGSIIDRAS